MELVAIIFLILVFVLVALLLWSLRRDSFSARSFKEFLLLLDSENVLEVIGEVEVIPTPRSEYELFMVEANPFWLTSHFSGKTSSGRRVHFSELYGPSNTGNVWYKTLSQIYKQLSTIANDERSVKYRDGSTIYSLDELRKLIPIAEQLGTNIEGGEK